MHCKSNATFSVKWWMMNKHLTTSITISSAMIHPVLPSICFPVTQSYMNFTPWQQTTHRLVTNITYVNSKTLSKTNNEKCSCNKFLSLKNNSFWVMFKTFSVGKFLDRKDGTVPGCCPSTELYQSCISSVSVMLLAAATTATCQVVADVGHGEDACTCLRQQPHWLL